MELINECSIRFAEDKDFRLLVSMPALSMGCAMTHRFQIVDSIMALFRADYSGRGELSERQQKVCQCNDSITRLYYTDQHFYSACSGSSCHAMLTVICANICNSRCCPSLASFQRNTTYINDISNSSSTILITVILQIVILLTNQVQCGLNSRSCACNLN